VPDDASPTAVAAGRPSFRPTKAAVIVAHALAERVAGLEPGAHLPSERELIDELKVGRNTLREALRLLEVQGVVSVKTGAQGGPIVTLPDHRALADTLSVFLQSSDVVFSEVVAARRAIEADLARLAAQRVTSDDIKALRASIDRMAEASSDEDRFLDENLVFHQCIAAAAGNEVLRVFHSSLKAISDGHVVGVGYSSRRRAAIVAAHEAIADAIEARDPDRSYEAADKHMQEFEEYLKRRYPELLNRRIRWILPKP
jgi:DNA-binding FadR family transcriptional regulator